MTPELTTRINPDDKTVLCLRRHREDVAGLDLLEFRNAPRSALGPPPLSRPS